MLETIIDSLDYFDNLGNNKLERELRIALKELDKDLLAAGYAAPKNVIEALNNLHEALEDVQTIEDENDLTEEDIVDAEFQSMEDEESERSSSSSNDDDDNSEDPD